MQVVHPPSRCEHQWCLTAPTRLELRRHTLGAFWEAWCPEHTSEATYGPSVLVAAEPIPEQLKAI